jgi:hypothetical protein
VPSHPQAIVAAKRAHRGKHEAVSVDETARRSTPALHLDDRRRDRVDGISKLSRKLVQHVAIVADAAIAIITQTGWLMRNTDLELT